eukprot:GHRR01005728.1.p1 GENE.GHRR01005728.1~~GHRR01005728.1.p1  ORF type:complete len:394 (+),score=149.10 GHRR01005728.1:190-1371(+)
MSTPEQSLQAQIAACDEGSEQHAALLTELAELNLSKGLNDEAQILLQKAYNIRGKDIIAGQAGNAVVVGLRQQLQQPAGSNHAQDSSNSQQAGGASPTCHSPAAPQINDFATASSRSSEEWEPDLSTLRTASSFERHRVAAVLVTGGLASPPTPAAGGSGVSLIAEHTTPHRLDHSARQAVYLQSDTTPEPPHSSGSQQRGSSSRPGSSGGRSSRQSSRPRGRGDSKCGMASDSDGDWDTQIAVQTLPHIVEMYGMNRNIKTGHLEDFLLDFMWGAIAPNLKWVDDEHALAVFPNAEAAQVLLDTPQQQYKVRPYSKASSGALSIPAEDLTPPRSARPKTTTAVARRLIGNALGNKQVRDRDAERELAQLRRANKLEKVQRQQQLEAAWGDDE